MKLLVVICAIFVGFSQATDVLVGDHTATGGGVIEDEIALDPTKNNENPPADYINDPEEDKDAEKDNEKPDENISGDDGAADNQGGTSWVILDEDEVDEYIHASYRGGPVKRIASYTFRWVVYTIPQEINGKHYYR